MSQFRRRRLIRAGLTGTIVLAMAASMAGCAPGGGQSPQPSGSDSGPITLTMWDYYAADTTTEAVILEQIDAYEAENPNVTIDRRFIAYADLKKSLLQSTGAGTLPDLVIINSPDHQQFAELGIAADLTDRIEEWGQIDEYAPGVIASATLDDKIYGLPFSANCLALFYNKALFAEAGLQPPTNWQELSDTASQLTAGDRFGLAYSAINNQQAVFQFLPTLWQNGGDLTDLTSADSVAALEYWNSLMADGSVSTEALVWDQGLVATEFGQGRAAMMINGPWQEAFLATDAPDLDYGVALLPKEKEEASVTGGENYMIIEGAQQDAAWDFLKWMQEPEQVNALALGSGSLPTRADAAPDDASALQEIFTEQLQVARPRAYGANYAEIADAVSLAIQSTLTGSQTAADALATANRTVEPLLP